MPATPAVLYWSVNRADFTITMYVLAGEDTSHVQFDRSWVPNVGSNDLEVPLATGQRTDQVFTVPTYGEYSVSVRARIGSTASSWVTRTASFPRPAPASFYWTNAKTAGGMYNLTATEWNRLLDKINEWRDYKGLAALPFNRTITSGLINTYVVPSAASYNSARNAIVNLSPSISPPSPVASHQNITAYHLNGLVSALNSLS